jgi:2-isopropylmalate synthase
VRLEEGGRIVTAQAADTDTIVASARAYVTALNKLIDRRAKGIHPQGDAPVSAAG